MSDQTATPAKTAVENQYTFTAGDPPRLKVENVRGLVKIRPALEPNQITVQVHNHQDGQEPQLTIDQAPDGMVQALAKYSFSNFNLGKLIFGLGNRPSHIDFDITIPPDTQVEFSGVSCDIEIERCSGEFVLSTVSGDIRLSEITGRLHLKTVSGDVTADAVDCTSGPAQFMTVSGDIRLLKSRLPSVQLNTVNGDVWIQTHIGAGPYRFDSVSGDVRLVIPGSEKAPAVLSLQSVSGDIHTPPAHSQAVEKDFKPGSRRKTVYLNGGGQNAAEIFCKSVSGNLKVEYEDGNASLEDEQPETGYQEEKPAPVSKASRQEILDQVARGELSVDEALKRIRE